MSYHCSLDHVSLFQPHFLILLAFLFCCTQVLMNVGRSTENALHLFEWRISLEDLRRDVLK